ncbi:MAG: SufE family protein, partial [Sphingomonadaceae bacterium]|nr:SufE family protein [Sphingomonadaceae bacterium]
MTALQSFDDIHGEFEFLDREDRYRLLIELGRAL